MIEKNKFLKKFGKWGPILGIIWLGLHVLVPLALLKTPFFKQYLIAIEDKIPFILSKIG